LHRGYHGTMAWMARNPARRADPRLVLPGCRSIIAVGMNYDTGFVSAGSTTHEPFDPETVRRDGQFGAPGRQAAGRHHHVQRS